MRGNYKSFKGTHLTVLKECTSLSFIYCKLYNQRGEGGVFQGVGGGGWDKRVFNFYQLWVA